MTKIYVFLLFIVRMERKAKWGLITVFVVLMGNTVLMQDSCFIVSSQMCNDSKGCKCKLNNTKYDDSGSLYCCNITNQEDLEDSFKCRDKDTGKSTDNGKITALHIRQSNISKLIIDKLQIFNNLVTLSITDSNVTEIQGQLPELKTLKCLNFTNIQLQEINPHVFKKLSELSAVVISRNNVTKIPELPDRIASNMMIDVSDIHRLDCDSLLNLTRSLLSYKPRFQNKNSTYCFRVERPEKDYWMGFVEAIPFQTIEKINEMYEDCPVVKNNTEIIGKCHCSLNRIMKLDKDSYAYSIRVNCTGLKMVNLPERLPTNTVILDVSNNSITFLNETQLPSYNHIVEFYAHFNHIESMAPLETSNFLHGVNILRLNDNRIKNIPYHPLANMLDRNKARKIYLGGNNPACECNNLRNLKDLLRGNKESIPDGNKIGCLGRPGTMMLELQEEVVCENINSQIDYLTYIIGLEVAAFVAMIGKVSYDYWVFKTYGYLPWPASKMPKLPCDWIFET